MGDYYIGLISGTSMDGIDAALVEFDDSTLTVLQTRAYPYPEDVSRDLPIAMHAPGIRTTSDVAGLHRRIGECFRDAALALLDDAGINASAIAAIGSHGQTVRHEPNCAEPFSLQVGDPDIIATGTGITTIADFRRADIELGGQGAPLAPAFHEWLLREPGTLRVVANIGGITNITVLPANDEPTTGYDTGPGNTLMDAWIHKHRDLPFDRDGAWAVTGTVDPALLHRLLEDAYFATPPPKSTGFEYFNLGWLEAATDDGDAADIQATLCELTAVTLADAVRASAAAGCELFICGGGVHNAALMQRITAQLPGYRVTTTAEVGLDPDWVEAVAFAWLAMRRLHDLPGNLPAVTGASARALLGNVHRAT